MFGRTTRISPAVFAVLLTALLCVNASARDLFVSPVGTAAGDGSRAQPLDAITALNAKSPAKPGDTIYLLGGQYDGALDGIKRVPFSCRTTGTAEQPIRVMPAPGESAHLNGVLAITGSFTHYIGLEIGDLNWEPAQKTHFAPYAVNATDGDGVKLINCNIFGGEMGCRCWEEAKNLEIYGCIIHDFGNIGADGKGGGHAFYARNLTGTKVFEHNLAYRGCGWNVYLYTHAAHMVGIDVLENICYLPGGAISGKSYDNFLLQADPAVDRLRIIGNVGYQPMISDVSHPNARLTSRSAVFNLKGAFKDNYLIGSAYGLSMGRWNDLEVTGNTIWSSGTIMEISQNSLSSPAPKSDEKPPIANYHVDRNTYIGNGVEKPFKYGRGEPEDRLNFERWQALGLDKNSQLLPGKNGKPDETHVTVFANKYLKGRGNVGIFNWDGMNSVEVDVSTILNAGQKYAIYNCLDIHQTLALAKPVLTGTFDGGKIAFPLRHSPASPDFDAFLIVPQGK